MPELEIVQIEDAASKTVSVFGEIMSYVVATMIAVILIALAVLWIIDQCRLIEEKDKKLAKLSTRIADLEKSIADSYKKNEQTAEVTDKIFDMYLAEKGKAESAEAWDAKQVKRIKNLEGQLRSAGIEPKRELM